MNTMLARWSFLLLCPLLTGQDPAGQGAATAPPKVSPAEQLFRDAWWAESGNDDRDGALRGYLAAVAAEGPAAVKARALLFAGRLQQRQGQAEAALTTLRRLVTQYAAETEMVDAARVHLRELTAVDLRQNYDEWYERRLFSEEVQLVVLGKIEALAALNGSDRTDRMRAAQQLVAELRAFGKGAVPGLRKAAAGSHYELANTAIDLLFEQGVVPPLAALLTNDSWSSSDARIRCLLGARVSDRLPQSLPGTPQARGLAAALQGAEAVTTFVLGPDAFTVPEMLSPWVGAILPDAGPRARLLAALQAPGTAIAVREATEQAFSRVEDPSMFSTQEWLALAADPVRAETRTLGLTAAARALREGDAAVLDALLAQLADRGGEPGTFDPLAVRAVAYGLNSNPRAELLPWTPARLRTILVALPGDPEAAVHDMVTRLRRTAAMRPVLAAALWEDPVALVAARRPLGDDEAVVAHLGQSFGGEADSADEQQLHARRWHATLVETLAAAWPKYDDQARGAALVVLRGAVNPFADRRAVVAFLTARRAEAAAPLQQAIDQALAALQR